MSIANFRKPSIEVGRVVGVNGHPRYALIVNDREIAISAHEPFDEPGTLMVSSFNERGDFRPIRLTVAGATALRDGLSLFIAEHSTPPSEKD